MLRLTLHDHVSMMNKKSITKSNELINSNFTFTLNEYRILMYGVSLINPLEKTFPETLKIDLKAFAEMFGLDVRGLYNDVKQSITKKFFRRELTIDLDGQTKKLCHWLDSITLNVDLFLTMLKLERFTLKNRLKCAVLSY